MKVIGIIAEYNPFHKGHAYQIETMKKKLQADYLIIAMSGNFVQRGAPALLDKFTRTKMALSAGADLVLELPVLYATASAEYFAKGGVSLLHNTGIVTHLGFGIENNMIDLLQEIADTLLTPPEAFQNKLKQELKNGNSFPVARSIALKSYFSIYKSVNIHQLEKILASPNNILAIEYLKALAYYNSKLIPFPLLRRGKGYHDTSIEKDFCSASAIRSFLQKKETTIRNLVPVTSSISFIPLELAMPEIAFDIFKNYSHPLLFEDDFSPLLHYKFLMETLDTLSAYADSSLALARRIKHELSAFTCWSKFCAHLKCKNITYTHLSRLFLHILLEICQEDYQNFLAPSYLRVLGFRKSSASLLTALKKNSNLPIVTSPANAMHVLPIPAQHLLSYDLTSTNLYQIGLTAKGDTSLKNDYQQPILRL